MKNTYTENKEIFKDFIRHIDSLNYCFKKAYKKKQLNKFDFGFTFTEDFNGETLFIIYFDCGSYVMSETFSLEQYASFLKYCDGIRDVGFAINGRS